MSLDLSQKIIDLREKRNWTQTELAEKMSFSKSIMSKIESGSRKISIEEIKRFSEIFHVNLEFLLDVETAISDQSMKIPPINLRNIILNSEWALSYDEGVIYEDDRSLIDDVLTDYFLNRDLLQNEQ